MRVSITVYRDDDTGKNYFRKATDQNVRAEEDLSLAIDDTINFIEECYEELQYEEEEQ